jgi:hypothetical protein
MSDWTCVVWNISRCEWHAVPPVPEKGCRFGLYNGPNLPAHLLGAVKEHPLISLSMRFNERGNTTMKVMKGEITCQYMSICCAQLQPKQLRLGLNEDGFGPTSFVQHVLCFLWPLSAPCFARHELVTAGFFSGIMSKLFQTLTSQKPCPLAWCNQAQPWRPPGRCWLPKMDKQG